MTTTELFIVAQLAIIIVLLIRVLDVMLTARVSNEPSRQSSAVASPARRIGFDTPTQHAKGVRHNGQ